VEVVTGATVVWVLFQVLTHGHHLVDEQGLLESGHSMDERHQDVLDKIEAVGPLVVVPWVVLVDTLTEG